MSGFNPSFPSFSLDPEDLLPAFLRKPVSMEFMGYVTPDGEEHVVRHALHGQLDSKELTGSAAAALQVVIQVVKCIHERELEFDAKVDEFNRAMEAYSRQSIIAKLSRKARLAPDDSELHQLDASLREMYSVLPYLSDLVFHVKEGVIEPTVFDEAVKRLNVEDLIASPIDSIVTEEVPVETEQVEESDAQPAPV